MKNLKALFQLPGPSIAVSRVLQSLATPLIAFLVSNAAELSEGTLNPISFCNVLFVGNTCAALVVVVVFGWKTIGRELLDLDRGAKAKLLLFGGLSALLSALIYSALETTMVTNAILLSRLGPLLYAILTALLLGKMLSKSQWFGFSVIVLGVFATVGGMSPGSVAFGDILILISTLVYAAVTMLSAQLLKQMSLQTVVFSRNAISALSFFIIANVLFGPHHFADAFAGRLWLVMLVYATIVIAAAQLLWYRAIKQAEPATIAQWTVLSPVVTVGYAILINGEQPSGVQLSALVLVTLGVGIANLGKIIPKGPSSAGPEGSLAGS